MKKMMLNKSLCAGCRYCEIVCSLVHSDKGEVNTKKARIKIISDPKEGDDYPNICHQCPKPRCISVCEQKAISVNAEIGNMVIDYVKCTGCLKCREACPFNAIQVDVETKLPLVCDLCGGDPNCIKHCRILPHIGARALNYVEPSEWKPSPRSSIKVIGDLK